MNELAYYQRENIRKLYDYYLFGFKLIQDVRDDKVIYIINTAGDELGAIVLDTREELRDVLYL